MAGESTIIKDGASVAKYTPETVANIAAKAGVSVEEVAAEHLAQHADGPDDVATDN